jgi:hypothetical protein
MARAFWEGLVRGSGEAAVLARDGTKVSDVIGRLELDRSAEPIARELGLDAAGMVAVMAYAALGDHPDGLGLPLVRSRPRLSYLEAMQESSLAVLFPSASRPARLAIMAGLLQVHDYWDESHQAAQEADDLGERSVSEYWHGVAHRREPDAGNATYWFRRVGRHPLFGPLGQAAASLINEPALSARLVPGGVWDPFAFIALCGSARTGESASLARRLQRLEMILLLEASLPV